MKFDKDFQEKALELLNSATPENKAEALLEAVGLIVENQNSELVQRITDEAEKAASDAQYRSTLGLRVLNKEEKAFYKSLKTGSIKQALTADQGDYIPTSIVDRTLDSVKKASGLAQYITFAPADVKRWVSAAKTGAAAWGGLADALTAELSATITSLNMEVAKLHVIAMLPKAIRDLGDEYVDRYFTAILQEAFNDGVEIGFLTGDGDDAPVGIYNVLATGHAAKSPATLLGFTPKQLAPVKKALSNNGLRTFDKLILICHPNDQADYVDPALFDALGNKVSSYKNIEVVASANNPEGKAAFYIPGMYTMGFSGLQVKDYQEVKALDDLDVAILKAYGNGRPVDDNVAFVIDVTKLEEYIPLIQNIDVTPVA